MILYLIFHHLQKQKLSHEAKCLRHSVVQRANVPTCQRVMASDATSAPLVARWALSGQLLGSCNTVDELKQQISQQLGVSSDLEADDLITHGLLTDIIPHLGCGSLERQLKNT